MPTGDWPAYDPGFLGIDVAPPAVGLPAGSAGAEAGEVPVLDYTHFTVAMNRTRRLAWWSAWNIDGLRLLTGDGLDRDGLAFRTDPRLPDDEQTDDTVYRSNRLDRGHLARRADLLWGALAEAQDANADSFFFTNITPQVDDFNQSSKGGVWGLLENALLAQEGLVDRRLAVFAGPVLADDDPPYRGIVQVPREHWKVVVYQLDGEHRFQAFLLTQNLERGVLAGGFLEEFRTYQVPLATLTGRTGLTFPGLDGLVAGVEGVPPDGSLAGPAPAAPRPIDEVSALAW